jgi:hypothetical protein
MNIYLDFFAETHGHFLEYVINTWLFDGPRVENIFTPLGTCHLAMRNKNYVDNRAVKARHYSQFNFECDDPDQLIRVSISDDYANWIYQINRIERAGAVQAEKLNRNIPERIRKTSHLYRNNWYAKFNFEKHAYLNSCDWRWNDTVFFDFPMESLFEVTDFYQTLYQLSTFLNTKFVPDVELSKLVENFLKINPGWQSYIKCKKIVEATLANIDLDFECTIAEQALINSLLTRSVGIFDGELFHSDDYPNKTSHMWKLIDHQLKNF